MDNRSLVILASYNPAEFIEAQIDSILMQDVSLIKIYDDDSAESALKYVKLKADTYHQRVKLIRRPKNIGVIENFRQAIAENGVFEIIYLSDQDDIWLLNKVDQINEILVNQTQPSLVYHDAEMINEKGVVIYPSFWKFLHQDHYQHRLETFLFGNFVTGGACAFNSQLVPYIKRMPEGLSTLHDAWIGLCAFVFGEVIRIPKALNHYRIHDHNVALTRKKEHSKLQKYWVSFRSTFERDLLSAEIELVEAFIKEFENSIPPEEKLILEKFYSLKGTSNIRKRIVKKRVLSKYSL